MQQHCVLNNEDKTTEETTNYSNDNQPLIKDPTLEEITKLIQTQRNGKALGEDNISIELLKNGGLELHKYLHKLILNIWKYEKIPEEWTKAIIIPLLKKGDRQECSNYRGISLLNIVYKIFSKLIQQRLRPYTENIIKEHQAGIIHIQKNFGSNRCYIWQVVYMFLNKEIGVQLQYQHSRICLVHFSKLCLQSVLFIVLCSTSDRYFLQCPTRVAYAEAVKYTYIF